MTKRVCGPMHPDVLRALSVVIDVDDVGEDGMRRQRMEDIFFKLKHETFDAFQSIYKFSVEERGWHITFSLVIESGECILRLADKHDHDDRNMDRSERMRQKKRLEELRNKNLSVVLPPVSKMTVDDLLNGVGSFLVADVMNL